MVNKLLAVNIFLFSVILSLKLASHIKEVIEGHSACDKKSLGRNVWDEMNVHQCFIFLLIWYRYPVKKSILDLSTVTSYYLYRLDPRKTISIFIACISMQKIKN